MRLFTLLFLLSPGILAREGKRGLRYPEESDRPKADVIADVDTSLLAISERFLQETDRGTVVAATAKPQLSLTTVTERPLPITATNSSDDEFASGYDPDLENALVGGQRVSVGEFPAFAQGAGCGGSLVMAKDIVLTAAHCDDAAFQDSVLVGAVRLNKERDGAQWRKVLQRVRHPNFDKDTANYDFMILKIEPVTNSSLKPAAINKDDSYPPANQWLTVVGFGEARRLRKAGVSAKSASVCSSAYPGKITSTMLCASAPGKDACTGDSGGPLMGGGRVTGVVSWGSDKGCALESYPGVYARVSSVASWIEDQVCKLSSSPPNSCAAGYVDDKSLLVDITVQYDRFPSEYTWFIESKEDGAIVDGIERDTSLAPFNKITRQAKLKKGEEYVISMRDEFGDGICCDKGDGYIEINTSDGRNVVSIWGDSGKAAKYNFSAPSD